MIEHRAVLNAVRDAIFVADLDTGMLVDANPAAEALSGRSLAELRRLHHTRLHPPEVEGAAGSWFAVDPQRPSLTEGVVLHKDGCRIPVEISSSHFTATDGRRMLAAVFRDLTERKQAKAKLEESEKGFRAIFSQAAVGIIQTTIDGQCLLLNDCICEMLGYSRDELLRKTFLDLAHPDDRETSLTAIRQLLSGEILSWSGQKRYFRKDGVIIWGKCFLSLVRDEHSQAQYFNAIVENITRRIDAERALRQAEQRLMLAQSAAHLGVWYRDWGTNLIFVSGEYARLHGLAPDRTTFTREEWISTIHPDDRERVEALRREARERTNVFNAEYRVIWQDGSLHWLLGKGAVILDDSGRPIRTSGVNIDITERKLAEEALRQSELLNQQVLDIIPDCIFVLDVTSDGRFQFVRLNPAEEKAVGLLSAQVAGKFVDEVLPEEVVRQVTEHYRHCLEAGTPIFYEDELNLPVGRRYFRTNLIPMHDRSGNVHRIVGHCADLTEAKRLQSETLVRQKWESMGLLAGGIAHDFNNLLGGVLAQAELALAEIDAGSSCRDQLNTIREASMRGSEIVRQLMIYAGKDSVAVGLVDLSSVVREMLELLTVSVSKHAVLEMDLANDLPAVRADAAQLRQIVMNLITNASDALRDRDGVIRVTTRRGGDSAGISGTLPEGDSVILEVFDTGCGMSQETQAKVFDPFFTTKSAGHGLGLAVVSGIVRGLGGTIVLASERGTGTTFRVLLPSAGTMDRGCDAPSAGEELASLSRDAAVLVVEDEDPLRLAVAKMLRKSGFQVLEAADGSSAINLLRGNDREIDLLLLDITIPGATSNEVVAEAAMSRPDIRVILTSAYGQEMITDAMSVPQIRSFIRKPFQLGDLVKTLRNSLSV